MEYLTQFSLEFILLNALGFGAFPTVFRQDFITFSQALFLHDAALALLP
jgi:hypothetical protein